MLGSKQQQSPFPLLSSPTPLPTKSPRKLKGSKNRFSLGASQKYCDAQAVTRVEIRPVFSPGKQQLRPVAGGRREPSGAAPAALSSPGGEGPGALRAAWGQPRLHRRVSQHGWRKLQTRKRLCRAKARTPTGENKNEVRAERRAGASLPSPSLLSKGQPRTDGRTHAGQTRSRDAAAHAAALTARVLKSVGASRSPCEDAGPAARGSHAPVPCHLF